MKVYKRILQVTAAMDAPPGNRAVAYQHHCIVNTWLVSCSDNCVYAGRLATASSNYCMLELFSGFAWLFTLMFVILATTAHRTCQMHVHGHSS